MKQAIVITHKYSEGGIVYDEYVSTEYTKVVLVYPVFIEDGEEDSFYKCQELGKKLIEKLKASFTVNTGTYKRGEKEFPYAYGTLQYHITDVADMDIQIGDL